jgi:hypothetical protein
MENKCGISRSTKELVLGDALATAPHVCTKAYFGGVVHHPEPAPSYLRWVHACREPTMA